MRNDGGSAYPISKDTVAPNGHSGMTLRDYFAAKAMQAFIPLIPTLDGDKRGGPITEKSVSDQAYAFADAMLKARENSDA